MHSMTDESSKLSVYIFKFMRANNIGSSKIMAQEAGVGWPWLRALYAKHGKGNPNSIPLQELHDFLVREHDMPSAINIPDEIVFVKEEKLSA